MGNGRRIRFWEDNWVPGCGKLRQYRLDHTDEELNMPSCFFVNEIGGWDIDRIARYIPPDIVQRIQQMKPPVGSSDSDYIAWQNSEDGCFSTRDAYLQMSKSHNTDHRPVFKSIWKWDGPERIKILLWKISQQILPINELRTRRHMTMNHACPLCREETESLEHALRDCRWVKQVWLSLPIQVNNMFFQQNINDWINANMCNNKRIASTDWKSLFGIALDRIWWRRNECWARNIWTNTDGVLTKIWNLIHDKNNSKAMMSTLNPSHIKPLTENTDTWRRPIYDFSKLNCDGAYLQTAALAACGAVLRNSEGDFIQAFSRRLGHCSILEAELWAILHGMNMARELKVEKLIVESDSMTAIKILDEKYNAQSHFMELASEIWKIKATFHTCLMVHTRREANGLADSFAKVGLSLKADVCYYNTVPNFANYVFMEDVFVNRTQLGIN